MPSVVERLVIWGKRSSTTANTLRRFWVNLQIAQTVTQKPLNVRMGKGKGGRKGVVARVNAGATLLAFSAIRLGVLKALARRIQVRASFKVCLASIKGGSSHEEGFVGRLPTWIVPKCLQKRYIHSKFDDFVSQLQQMKRPVL